MGPVFFHERCNIFGQKMCILAYINQNVSVQQKVNRNSDKRCAVWIKCRDILHYKCNINPHSLINRPLWRVILAVGTRFSGVAVVKR